MRRAMQFFGLVIVAALIYDGAIFYSRWNANRQAAQAQVEKEASQERKELDAMGGGGLKILSFYAAPGTIRRGAHTTLCYGVVGAKNVRIEPPVDNVWPALTRCVQVSPRKDAEYKFIADDGAGHSATQSITVSVK
jgi:hypothetical protein